MNNDTYKVTKISILPKTYDKLFNFIEKYKNYDETKINFFKNCCFTKIEYIPQINEINLNIHAPKAINYNFFNPVIEYFKNLLPEVNSINLDIKFNDKITINDIVNILWPDIINDFIKFNPACKLWLLETKPIIINDYAIKIEIFDDAGYYTLKERGIDQKIEKFILEKYDFNCRIFIEKNLKKLSNHLGSFDYYDNDLEKNLNNNLQSNISNQSKIEQKNNTLNSNQSNSKQLDNQFKNQENKIKSNNNDTKDTSIIFGSKIPDKFVPLPISELNTEQKNVVIEGMVINSESKPTKSGKNIITFSVTDFKDTILCKIFSETNVEIKPNSIVKVFGNLKLDPFDKELVLIVSDINIGQLKQRKDNAKVKRIELHAHSKMSALDSVTNISDYVKLAASWNHIALALTDHGVVQGFPDFYEETLKYKIKPIFGMEGYLIDDSYATIYSKNDKSPKIPSPFHIIILVKNQTGLKNLYKLVSLSHIEYYYKKPRIPRSKLIELREGLIFGTACEAGELIQAILNDKPENEIEKIISFYDYLEIQPIRNNLFMLEKFNDKFKSKDDLKNLNKKIYELGKKYNKLVCATSDMHYLNPEDAILRKILFSGQKYDDVENAAELYFPTTDEMLEEFSYLGEKEAYEVVVENPNKINELIENVVPIPRENAFPIMEGADEKIKTMAYENAIKIYGNPLPDVVKKRLDYELNCIIKNGFATLYLIAHELVKKSLEDGYLVGSRGSVGSSLVATFTNITEVNPLPPHYICPNPSCKYSEFFENSELNSGYDLPNKLCPKCQTLLKKEGQKIPFEVFLGFDGDKTPDIDLNFSGEYQPTIHKYVEVIFGENNVFRAGTISTIADKTAFGFVKIYLDEKKINKRNAEILRLAQGISGVKRTTGQHPGGMMIIPKGREIYEFTPINYPANDRTSDTITTHFDYTSIDKRLLKLDLLGHDDPTFIKMLQDLTGVNVYEIPFDDPKTLSIFSGLSALGITPEDINGIKIGTLGIPEFGTSFVRGMLEETKPKTFGELVRISGFSHGTDVWLNNAQMYIKSGVAKLSEAISVRDDIINYLIEHGMPNKLSFDIMENVRKGKGLKPEMMEAMKKHSIPEWYIESCNKIKYMFPKAHAVAYVMMAFRIAYFKVNYPLAFYATYFSTKGLSAFDAEIVLKGRNHIINVINEINQKGREATAKEQDLVTVLELVLEALARGVKFYPVDLYESHYEKFIIKNDGLICPFMSIQGLGNVAAQKIYEEAQKSKFVSLEDFKERTGVSKLVIEALNSLKVLDSLPKTDQMSFFD